MSTFVPLVSQQIAAASPAQTDVSTVDAINGALRISVPSGSTHIRFDGNPVVAPDNNDIYLPTGSTVIIPPPGALKLYSTVILYLDIGRLR